MLTVRICAMYSFLISPGSANLMEILRAEIKHGIVYKVVEKLLHTARS